MNKWDNIAFWFSLATIFALGIHFGQGKDFETESDFIFKIFILCFTGFLSYVGVYRSMTKEVNPVTRIFNGFVTFAAGAVFLNLFFQLLGLKHFLPPGLTVGLLIIMVLMGISRTLSKSLQSNLHPALIFVLSFAILILFGALLLMMPGASTNGISFVNALFTSTSAVSVTGLSVVDTQKDFTLFGQVIIVFLIQMGGLGILTFTNLFSILFSGAGSFKNQIAMADFLNSENLGNTQKLLFRIVIFVLSVELIGATFIYISVLNTNLGQDKIFFSIFHAISAFCNAGFSTLSNNLYEPVIRYNYLLHTSVAFLIIFGGLGYNISINYAGRARYLFFKIWNRIFHNKSTSRIQKNIIKINTSIVFYTTAILLLTGWIAFFVLEYNNSLAEHKTIGGKLAVAFFNSVSPRTAGFNNTDLSILLNPTAIIIILLMWIGASPGSTGGGIKTTTFAVSFMNLRNQVLGRERMEYRHKEIPNNAVERASVIMILSLLSIGIAVFILSILEPKIEIIKIVFECFSAFSTVGLSMGITFGLSDTSKIVIIIAMFLGRVSLLTFLIAFSRQLFPPKQTRYQYPKEDLFIN